MRNPKTIQGIEIPERIYYAVVYAEVPEDLRGVNPKVAEIKNDDEPIMDLSVIAEEDWSKALEEFRKGLREAFIFAQENPWVEFDFEIDEQMKREEELHG